MRSDAPVRRDMLVFGQPVVDEAAIDAVAAVLRSGWLGRGPQVQAFEQMFAQYVGSRHACALNSCSAGLFLSLHLLGIGRGDEVITTPMTFPATLNAIVNIGAMPVLVDVNRNDQNLDPEAIPQAITKRTRAIMPVHMTGRPCDMAAIRAVADEHGLPVIEDAAHALGACYRGHRIGSLSEFTAFSFQASKNLTTGDGGMLTTDNDEWAARARMLSVHGMSRDAWVQLESGAEAAPMSAAAGFKFTMTDIHAAMGLQQLPHFDEWQELRTRIWRRYDEALADLALEIPERPPPEMLHARHLYTVMLDIETLGRPRDELRAALRAEGIGTGVHYVPAHLHPYYAQRLGHERGSFPNAEWIGERTLSLPLSRALREDDQSDVIRAMQRVLT